MFILHEIAWNSFLNTQPDGKIPCLAIGKGVDDDSGEIVGITFQDASNASIRPVLRTDVFTEIKWNNAPTSDRRRRVINLLDARHAPANVPPQWQDFANTMQDTRNFILDQIQPRPDTLLEAFQTLNEPKTLVMDDLIAHATASGGEWTDNDSFQEWAAIILDGCAAGSPELKWALKALYPNLISTHGTGVQIVVPILETSLNSTLKRGVPHCLNYGYHKDQLKNKKSKRRVDDDQEEDAELTSSDDEEPGRQEGSGNERRGREEKRILLSKRLGKLARSRSRSPESSEDETDITSHVVNVQNVNVQNVRRPFVPRPLGYLLNNSDEFFVQSNSYFKFFEPHKPDLVGVQYVRKKVVAKFVCEIGNTEGGDHVTRLTEESTERCVESALAALAHDQKFILGIVIVVDGMKLIRIKRHCRQYRIKETPLVMWNEEQKLYTLLEMIRKAIAD